MKRMRVKITIHCIPLIGSHFRSIIHSISGNLTQFISIYYYFVSQFEESLKTVNCSHNGLAQVPRSGWPHDLEVIYLQGNQLDDLHEQLPVASVEHLYYLDLSGNQIKKLGRGQIFANFGHLRYLDLSRNAFRTLFSGVFRGLKRLEALIIMDGQLRYVDEYSFDGLENLRHLNLHGNYITSIYLELFQSILNLHVSNKTLIIMFSASIHLPKNR